MLLLCLSRHGEAFLGLGLRAMIPFVSRNLEDSRVLSCPCSPPPYVCVFDVKAISFRVACRLAFVFFSYLENGLWFVPAVVSLGPLSRSFARLAPPCAPFFSWLFRSGYLFDNWRFNPLFMVRPVEFLVSFFPASDTSSSSRPPGSGRNSGPYPPPLFSGSQPTLKLNDYCFRSLPPW